MNIEMTEVNFHNIRKHKTSQEEGFEELCCQLLSLCKPAGKGDHSLINEAQEDPVKFYRVKKMKFGGKGKEKDKTTIIYNEHVTMENVPLEAYDYVVNGKPALEWVMERQVVKTDKKSGIVNDANDYANETVGARATRWTFSAA
tara:strand:- start:6122 stop:6553 length:432 start_codon:yes stop_codon:yes gene_type:complete